jgi:hypothetical protein
VFSKLLNRLPRFSSRIVCKTFCDDNDENKLPFHNKKNASSFSKSKKNSYYEGERLDGKRHGWGRFSFSGCSYYEGQWQNGEMHGWGKLIFKDDSCYEGGWQNGKMHGKGRLTSSSGRIIAEYSDINNRHKDTKITILDDNGDHKFIIKEDVIYYRFLDEQWQKTSNKNKRLDCALLQLTDTKVYPEDKYFIVNNSDFIKKINELQQKAMTDSKQVNEIIEILGHAFIVSFDRYGNCYCFDNGGLKEGYKEEYFDVLISRKFKYYELALENSLEFLLDDDAVIKVGINEFCCRNLVVATKRKLIECETIENFLAYLGLNKKDYPHCSIVRANSFKLLNRSQSIE